MVAPLRSILGLALISLSYSSTVSAGALLVFCGMVFHLFKREEAGVDYGTLRQMKKGSNSTNRGGPESRRHTKSDSSPASGDRKDNSNGPNGSMTRYPDGPIGRFSPRLSDSAFKACRSLHGSVFLEQYSPEGDHYEEVCLSASGADQRFRRHSRPVGFSAKETSHRRSVGGNLEAGPGQDQVAWSCAQGRNDYLQRLRRRRCQVQHQRNSG